MPYLISPRRPITDGPGRWRIKKWYLHLRLDVDPRFTSSQLKQAFSGAEELEIDVFQPAYGSSDISNLELFEDIREVGKVRVTGSSCVDADYARWLEKLLMSPKGTVRQSYKQDSGEAEPWEVWTIGNR